MTGVQTCALPIYRFPFIIVSADLQGGMLGLRNQRNRHSVIISGISRHSNSEMAIGPRLVVLFDNWLEIWLVLAWGMHR